jgi:hypothetical protein
MTLIPLMDCCELLAIAPKTLRTYLKRAAMDLIPHPTDARIKCLTLEQMQTLSVVHGRPLQPPGTSLAARSEGASVLVQPQMPPPPDQVCPQAPREALSTHSPALLEEVELLKKLSCLETRVAQLSEHLAQLTLMLLQERDRTVERRITAVETLVQDLAGKPASPPVLPDREALRSEQERAFAPQQGRRLNPAEQLARSRMPPLIEYGARGTYVIVSSLEGELHLEPDSPQWFDWLATLSSFRFVGQQGRLTAYREVSRGRPSRSWSAHRCFHKQHYRYWLGVTDRLTIASLEQTAAKLQADVDAL